MRRLRLRRRQQGYTIVELMMAVAILMVSAVAIIAMQKAAAVSNSHAKDTAVAQRIAQTWAAQLEMDAVLWQANFNGDFLNTSGLWQRPSYSNNRKFGAAFDALGNPLTDADDDRPLVRFCTNVRLSPLFPNGAGLTGNATLRAEIRVFWIRDGATVTPGGAPFCRESVEQTRTLGLSPDVYRFVYQTVGVRQHARI